MCEAGWEDAAADAMLAMLAPPGRSAGADSDAARPPQGAMPGPDLATAPHTGITVQLCGDAHLSNFGLFGTPERRLIFDMNDFDETFPGPFEWDVKRLATSFAVAGRHRGFSADEVRALVEKPSA